MTAKEILKDILTRALHKAVRKSLLPASLSLPSILFETPKNENHGDYATNLALVLGGELRQPPRDIARLLLDSVDGASIIKSMTMAGPGFINFSLKESFWYDQLKDVFRSGSDFGKTNLGGGQKVQIEFVSANPTGPLHIGHGRGAALGDALANILTHAGYQVTREYYINDVGKQMHTLGRSVLYRYKELCEQSTEFPADHYQGQYIYDIAREVLATRGQSYLTLDESEATPLLSSLAQDTILSGIREDLASFGVAFDSWISERTLVHDGTVDRVIAELRERQYAYEKDGALWFCSSSFGDEKDRVLIRSNGQKTYFASDIAYHKHKLNRGFDQIINIWGADHHGYIPRLEGIIRALGYDPDRLRIVLVQIVSLLRGGVPVPMSTRMGQFVSLREVVDEVGRDAARYFFLMRRSDTPLDFDLELAKKQSDENPVFYVQYAHARLSSIVRVAEERGISTTGLEHSDLTLLSNPEEISLIKKIVQFPDVVESAAFSLEPHRIIIFLNDLVSAFHRYYHLGKLEGDRRVIVGQADTSRARLCLVGALAATIKNALSLLGVTAPERM